MLIEPLLIVAWVVSFAGNITASKVGAAHYEAQTCTPVIYDLGHELVPRASINPLLELVVTSVWLPHLLMAGPKAIAGVSKDVCLRFAFLLALRAITTVVTILPKDVSCNASKWTFSEFIGGACYDKVFSGHMAFTCLAALAMVKHGVWKEWFAWTYVAGMVLLLLFTRGHYTVDIVLGMALAWLTWNSTLFGLHETVCRGGDVI